MYLARIWLSFCIAIILLTVPTSCAHARTVLSSDMLTTISAPTSIQATVDDAYNNFDWNGKDVTITLSCGVYFQNFKISGQAVGQSGASLLTITGANLNNPTCVVIFANGVDACVVSDHARVALVGIQCQTSGLNSNSFLCSDYAICYMSFLGTGTTGNYAVAAQNGARIFYRTTTPTFNGGRTKFYLTANAAAAFYSTNPGTDLLVISTDIIISPGITLAYKDGTPSSFLIFAVNSYLHMVDVTYTSTPITGGKFRAYDHASFSDGSGVCATVNNIPGTGFVMFGLATFNSLPSC